MACCERCGRTGLLIVIVPGASRAVCAGERRDNPLRLRGVVECFERRSCSYYVDQANRLRERLREQRERRRPSLRAAVWDRDGGRCVDCGEEHPVWEADHVVPLADGGQHRLFNLATRCPVDHRSKTAQEARLRARRARDGAPL